MRRLPILFVLVCACSTFEDLEREYPFPDCPAECGVDVDGVCICDVSTECPADHYPNEIGVCVPVAQNNNAPPVNAEPNNTPTCQPDEAGTCCDGADPSCCVDPTSPNCQNTPTNNQGVIPLNDFAIGIIDVTDCANGNGTTNGSDIFAVSLTSNGNPLPLQLLWFEPGEGADQQGIDLAQALIDGSDPTQNVNECPQTEAVSLGCGGAIALALGPNGGEVGLNDFIELRVGESGPQCDGGEDRYDVLVCQLSSLQAGQQDGCYVLGQGVSGGFELAGQPADFLP